MKYITHCAQRGCSGEVESSKPPKLCPVCRNPLLDGGVTPIKETIINEPNGDTFGEQGKDAPPNP